MSRSSRPILAASALILLLAAGAAGAAGDPDLAARVKAEFQHAWNGYTTYAWGHDDLKPISRGASDWHEVSLLMTPVDAFSTMKLMHLDAEAAAAKKLILDELSFDHDIEVQVFEINIRLLGGLLSAYQLDGDDRFLELARDLADRLLPAFDSPTGMPYRYVNLTTGAVRDPLNNPAEIGTMILEWGTLSKHTGNPIYRDTALRALRELYSRRSELDLPGTVIDVETGTWIDPTARIGARVDSCFEYLLKGWLMFGDEELLGMWRTYRDAVHEHLADRTDTGLWYGQANMHTGERTGTHFGALDAYFPAVLALDGDLERAADLQRSCYRMWTLHGIEPEVIDYRSLSVVHPGYVLRPENIESAYTLYAITGEERYLDMGRTYFLSLVEHCRHEVAYTHLSSVVDKSRADAMQSFFLAETLKYSYLLFAPPGTVDFDKTMFNTEAHPLRVWRD